MRRRILGSLILACLAIPLVYVGWQAVLTLRILDQVERERDGWQRPDAVLDALNLRQGSAAIDFGSGAGYFALKLARIVGPSGSVLAVDLRRESLAFLWMRAWLKDATSLHVIHADEQDPHLPAVRVDAVLISNTYHELRTPAAILAGLRAHLKAGGRIVILDRAPRAGGRAERDSSQHELSADLVESDVREAGLRIVSRTDRFIDRAGDADVWWLLVAEPS